MKEKKHIIINQRIPIKVLNDGMATLLSNGTISIEELKVHMQEFFQGENRITKSAQYSFHVLSRPKVLPVLQSNFDLDRYNLLPDDDRNALLLNLIALTYPVAYDLLNIIGKIYKVQKQINRASISTRLSSIYGSNRSLYNALDALLPMLIELEIIKRTKISIYEKEVKKEIKTPLISELLIYTDIKSSESKTILFDDLLSRPWYMYFEPVLNFNKLTLLKYTESRIGNG
ncbi:hypothetical protein ACFLTA_10480, partial [Bacteroidota bacterium]